MHSPVLRDYDPTEDLTEFWSDWDYYSDDYYDEEPANKAEKTNSVEGQSSSLGMKRKASSKNTGRQKRRRKGSTTDVSEIIGLDDSADRAGRTTSATPIVVWRSNENIKVEPVIYQSGGERVSLLKNWRETFDPHPPNEELDVKPAIRAQRYFSDEASTTRRTVDENELTTQVSWTDTGATDHLPSTMSERLECKLRTTKATGPGRQTPEGSAKVGQKL